MTALALADLVAGLRRHGGLQAKRDIQLAARAFNPHPFPELGPAATIGDDAALLPRIEGSLLLACEGILPELVAEDPWFAGWSGVLVNLSDIAAMGGRPLALVNSLWAADAAQAARILEGMRQACGTFAVPMVGGHLNHHSPHGGLAVSVVGAAPGPVLSARCATAGDELWLLANHRGAFYRHYPFWDAATQADPQVLRAHLALLPHLALGGLVHAAKDISMGGLVGTAVMFAEAAGLGLELELDAIARPAGVAEADWLTCFPSYGYLLAVRPERAQGLGASVAIHPDLHCGPIGRFGAAGTDVVLSRGGETESLWRSGDGLTGF